MEVSAAGKGSTGISTEKKNELNAALSHILQSNFDAVSETCLRTLLKLIDNVLKASRSTTSHNDGYNSENAMKVRTIRLTNSTVHEKIVKPQGLQFLQALGFVNDNSDTIASSDTLTLPFEKDDDSTTSNSNTTSTSSLSLQILLLIQARRMIQHILVHELHVAADQLPAMPQQPVTRSQTTTTTATTTKTTTAMDFNVYQGQRFDGISAALADSNSGAARLSAPPGWKSKTEAELEHLTQTQKRLEQQLWEKKNPTHHRDWKAFRNINDSTTSINPIASAVAKIATESFLGSSNNNNSNTNNSKDTVGDASLLAAQLAKQQAERQAAEQRGFTTKAMRDLERLQKQKVYSHTHLRIQFPDGSYVSGNFGPNETCAAVLQALQEQVLLTTTTIEMELYMTPPRTLLNPSKTLQQLQLVPAAKIHVKWKKQPTDSSASSSSLSALPGWFIQPHWFGETTATTNNDSVMPESVRIVDAAAAAAVAMAAQTAAGAASGNDAIITTKRKKTKEEKEAALMKRMMGGR